MIVLKFQKEPYTIELLYGVELEVRPLNTAIYKAAQAKALRMIDQLRQDREELEAVGAEVLDMPDMESNEAKSGLSQLVFCQALACMAVTKIKAGVLQADGETPAEASEQALSDLMLIPAIADDFLEKYTRPFEDMIREGKDSPAAANGTSAAGPPTATGAASSEPPAAEESGEPEESAVRT